jgi:hypothetical protein
MEFSIAAAIGSRSLISSFVQDEAKPSDMARRRTQYFIDMVRFNLSKVKHSFELGNITLHRYIAGNKTITIR